MFNSTDYRRHLTARGYSDHTARAYAQRTQQFLAWLGDRPLTSETLAAYRDELRRRSAVATVHVSLAALSLYVVWLARSGRLQSVPTVPGALFDGESRQGKRP